MVLQDSTRTYVYGLGGQLISQVETATSTPSYLLQDGLSSTVALTDAAGTVTATTAYDAFGAVRSSTGTSSTAYGYTGQQTDASGLQYLRARYYDPALGRFLSKDPLVQGAPGSQGFNRYAYVANSPINLVDPSGLAPWDEFETCLDPSSWLFCVLFGPRPGPAGSLQLSPSLVRDFNASGDDAARGGGKAARSSTSFVDRNAARQALSGRQQVAANRFFKGATGKSRDFMVTELGDDCYRLEFFSPANNAGYGKRYVEDIDAFGGIIREFRETIGPEGIINVKWTKGSPE